MIQISQRCKDQRCLWLWMNLMNLTTTTARLPRPQVARQRAVDSVKRRQ
jgi:hypothetical protein